MNETRRPAHVPTHRTYRTKKKAPKTDQEEIIEIMGMLELDEIHYLLAVARTLLKMKNKHPSGR